MKTDIFLLSDIFKNFLQISHKTYGLDLTHSFIIPGYTRNCMLKFNICKFETFQNVDM